MSTSQPVCCLESMLTCPTIQTLYFNSVVLLLKLLFHKVNFVPIWLYKVLIMSPFLLSYAVLSLMVLVLVQINFCTFCFVFSLYDAVDLSHVNTFTCQKDFWGDVGVSCRHGNSLGDW